MRGSIFDYVGNLDTLIAVIVGACLATGGALIAEVIQDRLGRRRRERDAARFFGEIISSIDQIFDLAVNSMKIGDPWGTYTLKIFSVIASETDTYFRNRERVFDIRDMQLRFALHGDILRINAPISSVLTASDQLEELNIRLEENSLPETVSQALQARIERLKTFRESSLDGAKEERAGSAAILARLERLAQTKFEARY